jgi:transcriptional regulator with GAF, ATPase, and Fis domain
VHLEHRVGFMAKPEARPIGGSGYLLGRRRDGSQFPVEVALNPVQTEGGTLVLATVVDINARCQGEEANRLAIEAQLEFERLVAELSTKFINLPVGQVDDAIRDGLRRIGEALDLDRCTFFRIQPDEIAIDPVGWQRPGIPPAPAPISIREQFPWVRETILTGRVLSFSSVAEIPNPVDREGYRLGGVQSSVTVPLSVAGHVLGAVGFNMLRAERSWPPEVIHRLRVFATAFGNVLARREADEALQRAFKEVERLRDQLQAENVYLRAEARERLGTGIIVGQSEAIRRVLDQVRLVAATDSTVLLLGETGTGKELFATELHESSGRRARPMVRVNCAAIPATLLESELFGREKGAFTGALARQVGRFELADRSTIFLDEIGDLPVDVQVKLLRVLEEQQIERLGSPKPIRVDTRIIAATHRNLEQLITEGRFRDDLFYRLNVFPISVPPLRERVEDIPLLVWRFIEEFSKAFAKPIDTISQENMAALQRYSWPGNIRELRNIVERAMIVARGPRLTVAVPPATASGGRRGDRLIDIEKEHIRRVLESTGWRIRGASGAAERLGLPPTTLETRLAKLGLKRPKV